MYIYNIGIRLYGFFAQIFALWSVKARLWIEGRKALFARMEQVIDSSEKLIWIHVASLGEFEQGRPILEKMRELLPDHKLLLTLFSPSCSEVRRSYNGADYIFELPLDTPQNA